MTTAGLDQIAEAYRQRPAAQVAAAASLEVVLGRLADHLDWSHKRARRAAESASIFPFPAQLWPVVAGAPTVPTTVADAMAPKDGYTWFATRMSIDGLVAGGGATATGQGQATTPGAGATIASIAAASITPGTYMINWITGLAGTPAAADTDNFRLRLGSTGLDTSANPGAAGQWTQAPYGPILLTGSAAVNIIAVGAGTAGAIYDASITLTPTPADAVTLYRGPGITQAIQPQNRLHTFTAQGSSPGPDWTPGTKGCPLKPQQALVLSGTGLAASQLMLSGDVIQIEDEFLFDYLM